MRSYGTKIENNGATVDGRLAAAEDNARMRELENVVSTASLTLDPQSGPDADLKMISQSMARYASGGVYYEDSGAANVYLLASPSGASGFVVPNAYFEGMIVLFRVGASNTSAATINVNSIGSKSIKREDGTVLTGGELVAGQLTALEYDGTDFRVMPWANALNFGSIFISYDQTWTVGTGQDYADLNAAFVALRLKIIADGVTVTLSLSAGTHNYSSDIDIDYAYAHRVEIVGAALPGADPAPSDFVTTGHDATARGNDAATNLAMLQGKYATELILTGCSFIIRDCGLGMLDDVLITGDGSVNYGLQVERARILVGTVSAHGFGDDNVIGEHGSNIVVGGVLTATGGTEDGVELPSHSDITSTSAGAIVICCGNGSEGFEMWHGGESTIVGALVCKGNGGAGAYVNSGALKATTCDLSSNGGDGLIVKRARISFDTGGCVCNNNGNAGLYAQYGSNVEADDGQFDGNGTQGVLAYMSTVFAGSGQAIGNGNSGYYAWFHSAIHAASTVVSGNGATDYVAEEMSYMKCSSTSGSYSPAVNTDGNHNSRIRK